MKWKLLENNKKMEIEDAPEKLHHKKMLVLFSAFTVLVISITAIHSGQQNHYPTQFAFTRTENVGGLIPYNINSDWIVAVPEDYFLRVNNSNMTYEELVSDIGEPSGTVGSGIVRKYWRIGENQYAVCHIYDNNLYFEIWHEN